ncbi:a-type inclusion protein [Anaeramoeba flamelloides]|uniref:A-type inclusion protein n=1 Tax=Anaeramoeba flamelloides TaxID=1746091 RepID=A0AAV8A892_9EUKA|nr:a-type inclusion protein [Anaeramoeba flamelloides]
MNKNDVMKLIEKFSKEGSTTNNNPTKTAGPKRQYKSSLFTKKTTNQTFIKKKQTQPLTRRNPPIKSNKILVTNKQRFSAPKKENELEKNPRFQTQKSKYSLIPKKKISAIKVSTPKEDENKTKNQPQKKIEELTQRNKKLENEIQQLEEKQNQLEVNTKQKINDLEKEKKNLDQENQKNKNGYEDLKKKNNKMLQEFEKMKQDFEKEIEKTKKLKLEIESKNEKILELETKLKKEKEKEKEKKQKVNHQEKAEEGKVEEKEKDKEKDKIQYSKFKNKIENLEDQIKTIKLENKELKLKNEDLRKDNNKTKQHLEEEKEENVKLKDKIKSNESESKISTHKIEQERLKFEEQIGNLKQTITSINKDNEKLNNDLKENKKKEHEKSNSLIQQNEFLEKQNKSQENKNNSLEKKIEKLTKGNGLLQEQVLTLEENLNKAEQREVEIEKNHKKEIQKILNQNKEEQEKIKKQDNEETNETEETNKSEETEETEEIKEQNEKNEKNKEKKRKEKNKSGIKKRKTKKTTQTNNLISDDQIEDNNKVKTKKKKPKKDQKKKHLASSGKQSKNQGIQLPIKKHDLDDSPDTTKMPIYINQIKEKPNLLKKEYELETQPKKTSKGKRNKREKGLKNDPRTEVIQLCILLSSDNLKTDRVILLNAIEFARDEINKLNKKLLFKVSCIIYNPEKEQSEENEGEETKKTKQNTRLKFYYKEQNKKFLLNKLKNKKQKDEANYPNLLEALQVIRKTKWKSKHNLIIHWFKKKFFKMNGLLIDDDYLTLLTKFKKQNIFYYAIGLNLKTEKKKINSFRGYYKTKKKNYLFHKISRKSEKTRFEWDGFLVNIIINVISKNDSNNKLIELIPQLSNKERKKWNNATDVTAFYPIINEKTFRTIYSDFNSKDDDDNEDEDYGQTSFVQNNKIHIELISKQSKIKISKEPFLLADTYKFYYLKDVNIPSLLVAKAFKMSEFNTEISQYLKLLKTISYTLLFAKIFNNHECIKKKICFWGKLLYSKQKNEDDFEYFFVEPFLQNYNYINLTDKEELNTIHAFRHFSYQFSNQKILIGKCNKIGDKYICPHIHSQRMVFGYEDGGYSKLLDFKEQHICNQLCKKLGLTQLRN